MPCPPLSSLPHGRGHQWFCSACWSHSPLAPKMTPLLTLSQVFSKALPSTNIPTTAIYPWRNSSRRRRPAWVVCEKLVRNDYIPDTVTCSWYELSASWIPDNPQLTVHTSCWKRWRWWGGSHRSGQGPVMFSYSQANHPPTADVLISYDGTLSGSDRASPTPPPQDTSTPSESLSTPRTFSDGCSSQPTCPPQSCTTLPGPGSANAFGTRCSVTMGSVMCKRYWF